MDAVFGPNLYLNEITWKRSSAHSDTRQGMRRAGRIRDVVLVYSKGQDYVWNPQYMPYDDDYLQNEYRHVTPDGRRYKETDVTAARARLAAGPNPPGDGRLRLHTGDDRTENPPDWTKSSNLDTADTIATEN